MPAGPVGGVRSADNRHTPEGAPATFSFVADRRPAVPGTRAAVLAAAQQLVDRDGPAALRIAEVAAAAHVGPGTIYRRIGGKRELLLALVAERERDLEIALLAGAPPLGPGAPAEERIVALVDALHTLVLAEREVLAAADEAAPVARFAAGAHAAWRTHLMVLLADVHPEADVAVLADIVLATLSPGLHVHLVDQRRVPPARVRAELLRLARLVATRPERTPAAPPTPSDG
jgi:AcrR family transcriptional regulator